MNVLFILGTRPEAIKMAPLIRIFNEAKNHEAIVCSTGQHKEMLDQVLDFFSITPDYDLKLMKPNQDLFDITAAALLGIKDVLEDAKPDLVFVQGDTTTAFIGGLAAFYKKIKVAHLEAGLRSNNMLSPFPEEANRQLVGRITTIHFAPTLGAKTALLKENVDANNIHIVGNTVIDALLTGVDIVEQSKSSEFDNKFDFIDFSKRIILITGHRRESFGEPFEQICKAINTIADLDENIEIIYPVHLNPNVRKVVFEKLSQRKNIHLIEPLSYPEMIWLMNKTYFILTDSGGIQEEAPSLGKPVLVMRDVTERMEGISSGTAKLVGTNAAVIIKEAKALLTDAQHYNQMAQANNPYGDGTTSKQVLKIINEKYA